MKLDNFQSLVIDPASITVVEFDGDHAQLLAFNDTNSDVERFAQKLKKKRIMLGGGSGEKTGRKK
jgi:hypothetical protein